MIRPASNYHPLRNLLVRSHAAASAQRFHGTEADSTAPPTLTDGDTLPPSLAMHDDSGWPTTRRYARTMHGVNSAWPDSPEYADPIDPLLRAKVADSWTRAQRWVFVVGAVGGIVIAAAGYL